MRDRGNGEYTFTMPGSRVTVDAVFTDAPAAMPFADVPETHWAAREISWAMESGCMNGTAAASFTPNGAVTRQQLAALLYRLAVQNGYDVSAGENTNILSYTDVRQLSEYAVPVMQWACGAGIIRGTGDGSALSPRG